MLVVMGFPRNSGNEAQDIDKLLEIDPMENLWVPNVELSNFSVSGPVRNVVDLRFNSNSFLPLPRLACCHTLATPTCAL
jgi:hypothetical protein